jgi:hypothetical protein
MGFGHGGPALLAGAGFRGELLVGNEHLFQECLLVRPKFRTLCGQQLLDDIRRGVIEHVPGALPGDGLGDQGLVGRFHFAPELGESVFGTVSLPGGSAALAVDGDETGGDGHHRRGQ